MLEDSSNTEIAYFDSATLSHEDVLSLQISMQDLFIMNVLESKSHLNEPIEDLIFAVADYKLVKFKIGDYLFLASFD